jgi:hypothetical protein
MNLPAADDKPKIPKESDEKTLYEMYERHNIAMSWKNKVFVKTKDHLNAKKWCEKFWGRHSFFQDPESHYAIFWTYSKSNCIFVFREREYAVQFGLVWSLDG